MIKSALVLTLCAVPLLAQAPRRAALGDRVRLQAPKAGYGRLTGQVTATTPDAIQVRLDGGTEVAVMREQIDAMFVSLSTRRNTMRGAIIGAVAAGAGAFMFGPKKVSPTEPPGTPGRVSTTNVVSATLGGAAVGALIGYYTRSDTWLALSPRQ